LLSIAIAAPVAAAPAPDETIVVFLDQAQIVQLPDRAATIVIGNPLIADLSIQTYGIEKRAVITGKGYGTTNLIVLDDKGVELMSKDLEVTGPIEKTVSTEKTVPAEKIVVVYRGVDRETFSCTPDCSRRLTLGDTPDFFEKALTQITTRNAQATSAGAMASGH
jgi:Flp pilus assembly secretin CpaC